MIYELIDKTIDHGYPQVTDLNILKEYIKTEINKSKKKKNNETDITNVTTGDWTHSMEKNRNFTPKNENYMDVIERVTCLII